MAHFQTEDLLLCPNQEVIILNNSIPEFRVREGVTRKQLLEAGFEEYRDHWTLKQFLYEKIIYVIVLISKEDLFCTTRILKNEGYYAPFYNRHFGPSSRVRDKIDERYARLLRRLNRADVIEFL